MDQDQRRHAVVVGAGLAGLACARQLVHMGGWRVTVLEARDRAGGRVHTSHVSLDSSNPLLPVDEGASFIHGISKNPVATLAMHAGGDLHAYSHCPLFDDDGQAVPPVVDADVEVLFNLALAQASKRRTRFPEESLEDAVHQCIDWTKLNKQEQRVFNWHLSNLEYSVNADLAQVRNRGWDADDPFGLLGQHCVVEGGMAPRVVGELLSSAVDVRYNTEVRQIDYSSGDSVTVHVTSDSVLCADVCICTLPLGVLKKVVEEEADGGFFHPVLPQDKRQSIASLGFGLLNKISLVFPSKFWGEELFGYCSRDRGKFPLFVDASPGLTGDEDSTPAVLTCLLSGSAALDQERCSDAYLVRQLVQVLQRVYGAEMPPVLCSRVTRWAADRFARGSYSYVALDSTPRDYDVLAAPVSAAAASASSSLPPRLFFAGEHTNRMFPASVHGAFFSGVREAKRVHELWGSGAAAATSTSRARRRELSQVIPERDVLTADAFAEMYSPQFTFALSSSSSSSSSSTGTAGRVVPSKFPAEEEEEEEAADAPAAVGSKRAAQQPSHGRRRSSRQRRIR